MKSRSAYILISSRRHQMFIFFAKLSVTTSAAYVITKHYKNNRSYNQPTKTNHIRTSLPLSVIVNSFYCHIDYNKPYKQRKYHNLHPLIFINFHNLTCRLFSVHIIFCNFYCHIDYNKPYKQRKYHNLHLLIFICLYNLIYIISARFC